MRTVRKSYGRLIAFLMLLFFAAALIPLDFYHNHSETTTSACKDVLKEGACHHKLHLTAKSKPCWLCAAHYDNVYIQASVSERTISFPAISILSANKVTGYFIKLVFSALRGPPAE